MSRRKPWTPPPGTLHLVDVVNGVEVHTVQCPPPGLDASGWEALQLHAHLVHRRAVDNARYGLPLDAR